MLPNPGGVGSSARRRLIGRTFASSLPLPAAAATCLFASPSLPPLSIDGFRSSSAKTHSFRYPGAGGLRKKRKDGCKLSSPLSINVHRQNQVYIFAFGPLKPSFIAPNTRLLSFLRIDLFADGKKNQKKTPGHFQSHPSQKSCWIVVRPQKTVSTAQ